MCHFGLQETVGQPELIVCGVDEGAAAQLIHVLADMVANGGIPPTALADRDVRLRPVHPGHLRGEWFRSWEWYYGRPLGPGGAEQAVPGPSWFCACHRSSTPRLDRPPATSRTR